MVSIWLENLFTDKCNWNWNWNYQMEETNQRLVLGGGGVRGFAFIGGLKALSEKQEQEQQEHPLKFERITGTSIGAIVGLMVLLGYSPLEMEQECVNTEFSLGLEGHFGRTESNNGSSHPLDMLEKFGINSGKEVLEFIKMLIRKKTKNANLTLKQMHVLFPTRFDIVTVCVNDHTTKVFNYLDTPNVMVYTAIRMSVSVPILFQPVKYLNKYYIDGGLLSNVPIGLEPEQEEPVNTSTLVFRIVNTTDTTTKINSIQSYLTSVVYCVLSELENIKVSASVSKNDNDNDNNIKIKITEFKFPPNAPGPFSFQISKRDRKKFIKLGYRSQIGQT